MTNSIFLSYSKPKVAVLKYLNRILIDNRQHFPLKTQTNENQRLKKRQNHWNMSIGKCPNLEMLFFSNLPKILYDLTLTLPGG